MDPLQSWSATYAQKHPQLKQLLRKAHIREFPSRFVKKSAIIAIYLAIAIGIISFLFVSRFNFPWWWVPASIVIGGGFGFVFMLNTPVGLVRKRAREIDEEVLFIGRYLLIKVESGTPLFNSLIDASQSYGASAKYIKEIVDEIIAGKPIEEALEAAWEYNSSDKFKRILFQILSSLKTGTELGPVLKTTLRSLTSEQILEVKEYGKKLNTFMMFYLVVACILPSLGLTMLVVISSFVSIKLDQSAFLVLLFFMVVIQMFFIILIKAARPAVNL